ncbi:MAG: ROK family protein [Clostridia bacterium]
MKSPEELRVSNELKVLRHLLESTRATKVDTARETGLTLVTVNSIFNGMKGRILEEAGTETDKPGRNPVIYAFRPDRNHILGITVYIEGIAIRVENLQKSLLHEAFIKVDVHAQYDEVLEAIKREIPHLHERFDLVAAGVAIPGAYDGKSGKITFSPNILYLRGKDFRGDLETLTGLRTYIEKDVHSAALILKDMFHKEDVSVFLSVRGGVGCSVMYKGEIIRGAGSMAGETGHFSIDRKGPACSCGKKGCLEMTASDHALLNAFPGSSLKEIIQRTLEGEQEIIRWMKQACGKLSILVEGILQFYDPGNLVINSSWISRVPEVRDHMAAICKSYNAALVVVFIDEEKIYEQGSILTARDRLFHDIHENILTGGTHDQKKH